MVAASVATQDVDDGDVRLVLLIHHAFLTLPILAADRGR
jgi:hypothetical protein